MFLYGRFIVLFSIDSSFLLRLFYKALQFLSYSTLLFGPLGRSLLLAGSPRRLGSAKSELSSF